MVFPDSVRIELNYRISSWCCRIAVGVGKPPRFETGCLEPFIRLPSLRASSNGPASLKYQAGLGAVGRLEIWVGEMKQGLRTQYDGFALRSIPTPDPPDCGFHSNPLRCSDLPLLHLT